MTTASAVEVVSLEGRSTVLKRDSLGISSLFFCIATAAAPMTALLFNVPVIVSGVAWAAPAAFIVALVMLLIFSVGYVEMTRRVTSAGGFYSFVSHGFGQILGLGTASVITFSYTILTASIVGIFAYFAKTTISDWTGANIPLIVLLMGAVVVCPDAVDRRRGRPRQLQPPDRGSRALSAGRPRRAATVRRIHQARVAGLALHRRCSPGGHAPRGHQVKTPRAVATRRPSRVVTAASAHARRRPARRSLPSRSKLGSTAGRK